MLLDGDRAWAKAMAEGRDRGGVEGGVRAVDTFGGTAILLAVLVSLRFKSFSPLSI